MKYIYALKLGKDPRSGFGIFYMTTDKNIAIFVTVSTYVAKDSCYSFLMVVEDLHCLYIMPSSTYAVQ